MTQTRLSPREVMTASPIMPVIALEDAHKAIDLAQALMHGGVKVLEITLRTAAAVEAIQKIAQHLPDAIVGAGTVLNIKDLHRVIDAGAKFAISPGSTDKLLAEALELDFPLLPGVATASEIMMGLDLGYTYFKLFPAMSAGGITALKSFSGPFPQAMFCPTGGINEQNFLDFLQLKNVLCIGGTWIAPDALTKAGNFSEITRLTSSALDLYKQAK